MKQVSSLHLSILSYLLPSFIFEHNKIVNAKWCVENTIHMALSCSKMMMNGDEDYVNTINLLTYVTIKT
jgi:hypothetical protein